ncbi:hypothetical protein RI129_001055 [Pyrocoelia pectoralis]|uniref:WD repeat-containing protein 60 n=1 Tax=Pyrocoelia pectoralis TaxID=417401 RepID=A0AAN7VTX5_9COLE
MSKSSTVPSENIKPTKIKQEINTDRNFKKVTKTINSGTSSTLKNSTKVTQSTPLVKQKQAVLKTGSSIKNNTGTEQTKPATRSNISHTNLLASKKSSTTISKPSLTSKQSASNNVSKQKKSVPSTPPSTRVSKTHYFPSKNMYSNAIQQHIKTKVKEEKVPISSTPKKDDSTKSNTAGERPRTATLKRSSIVNLHPDGDNGRNELLMTPSLDTEDNIYEDDFDSYESDFEEYQTSNSTSTSFSGSEILEDDSSSSSSSSSSSHSKTQKITTSASTEERMLDSGNFDMHDNQYKQILGNISEFGESKPIIDIMENNRSNLASLSDEGFEDSKSSLLSNNVQCINFIQAQKKIKHNKHMEKQKKRGRDILGMIKLDHYNFTLIEMAPVSYDVFIQSFGNLNSKQIFTQTGDDNESEEVQTELIETDNKWTQYPIKFSKIDCNNSNYLELYKQEYAGVSIKIDNFEAKEETSYKFEKNLLNASQLMLNLLYESQSNCGERVLPNSREIPFSNGYVKFNTESLPFLKGKPITFACYCFTNKLLTVHGPKEEGVSLDEDLCNRSIICIWNILNCEEPEKIFNVPGILNCCYTCESNHLVIGGLKDGALSVWNLRDSSTNINQLQDVLHAQPNYTTGVNKGHTTKVMSIKQLELKDEDIFKGNKGATKNQICSLDEIGTLIVWIIIKKSSSHQNLLFWNQISLVQNIKMCLNDSHPDFVNLLCTDMLVNFLDTHHILISTNYGYIIHCLSTTPKAKPKKYHSNISSQINCLISCPFSSQYFLAGHDDGTITLYSCTLQKSLIALSNKNESLHSSIECIQWCNDKPCLFYVKDSSNTIHVWDLKISDLFPLYSVPFKEKITVMKLSKSQLKENETSYMVTLFQ